MSPLMQSECRSGTGQARLKAICKVVGDLERSIWQKRPKTMKLKGIWYIAGYCLFGIQFLIKRKLFSSLSGRRVGGKSQDQLCLSLQASIRIRNWLFGSRNGLNLGKQDCRDDGTSSDRSVVAAG